MSEFPLLPNGTHDIPKDLIKGYECVFGTYRPSAFSKTDDAVIVKEKVHLKDGRIIPQVRTLRNQKREFYITKEGFRKHEQKKEYEEIKKCNKYTTTHRKMPEAVARALNRSPVNPRLGYLCQSPYVYGTDISPIALVKEKYTSKYADCKSNPTMAVLDLETNMHSSEQEILSGSLTMKDKLYLVVTKGFIGSMPNFEENLFKCFHKHLGSLEMPNKKGEMVARNLIEERNLKLTVDVVEDEGQVAMALMKKAHVWKPDFIGYWNINFDLKKLLTAIERHRLNPDEIFSDPAVPREFKFSRYKEAQKIKTTASGKTMIKHMADLWHVMYAPSSFYHIDLMCLYKLLRVTEGNQPSYSLDAILGINNLGGKLRFKEAEGYVGPEWHKVMQKQYKLEYLVYNLFDCIGVEMLEEKNNDLKTFQILCGYSDFDRFTSTPRRICDDLHYYCLERGLTVGSTSDAMETELDKLTYPMTDWMK